MQKSQSTKVNRAKSKPPTSADIRNDISDSLSNSIPQPLTSYDKSENVRVTIRVRPMNESQIQRGDANCLNIEGEKVVQINHKGVHKSYQFNGALDPSQSQENCYKRSNINSLIDSAIQGYSATVFAYGQTGSGKTYTMAGKQQLFTRQVYRRDEKQGIIPRAIHYLWSKVSQQKNRYFVKASYTQIYNEQIKDLLNLSSGVLHCRWNPSNGFFVQDLIVVDCSDVDDMISVLNEGMKNRRSGSHELNKDSSRSHSILTMYIISEMKSGSQTVKKYGKIAFVDLAGSQRLKQSKSQGQMIKETGNINKSLFTLGKVIKGLTDKKSKTPYIPYRDSKLTMLLMDSLGGNSKALMIACASPSQIYFDETLSTLNYAARTMNIRNKPLIQMDQKDQIIQEIQSEIETLKKQNIYLRQQYQRINKGLPIKIPELQKSDMIKTFKIQGSQSTQLPPLDQPHRGGTGRKMIKSDADNVISDYQLKFEQIKKENEVMRRQKDESEQMYRKLMETNGSIQNKLENLEQIFLNKKKDNVNKDEIITTGLLTENTQLKKRLREMEKEKVQIGFDKSFKEVQNFQKIEQENEIIQKQIERLQFRQKELLAQLQKKK